MSDISFNGNENKYELREQVTEKKIRVWKIVAASLDEDRAKEIATKGTFNGNEVFAVALTSLRVQ